MNEKELKEYILLALNFPGQKGKLNSAYELFRKVCKVIETEPCYKGFYAASVDDEKQNSPKLLSNEVALKTWCKSFDKIIAINANNLKINGRDDRFLVKLEKDENENLYVAEFVERIGNMEELTRLLKELEIEGKVYVRNGQYRSFPDEIGFVQGPITFNENNEGFITSDLGVKYYIHPNDLKDALDGDIVVIKPTNRLYQGNVVSKVDKIIQRKDGLLTCKVQLKKGKKILVPCARITLPLNLEGIDINELEAGTSIVVRIGMPEKSCYNAKYEFTIEKEIANSEENAERRTFVMDDEEIEIID